MKMYLNKVDESLEKFLLNHHKDEEDVNKLFLSIYKIRINNDLDELKIDVDNSSDVDFSKLSNNFKVTIKRETVN
jgi:hypothetical protein